MYLAIISI